jgi:glycosyltransferase involved in cell wall biosynthesis
MSTRIFIGLPSYNRARMLQRTIRFFFNSKIIHGFIIVAESTSEKEYEEYVKLVNETIDNGFEVIHALSNKRLGSAPARNKVLELAGNNLNRNDVLVMYDDDFVYPGDHSLVYAPLWLKHPSIGLVGGRVINLRKRRVDPDFYLNLPYIADALTRLTGFIVLDVKHGPRSVEYTPHLFAIEAKKIISMGIRYDENYGGTGYREESDFQKQIRELGYNIIFEPRFYAYHLALEMGGDRGTDLENRMYWKWRNHSYFMTKWRYPIYKKIFSYMLLTFYALLNGPSAIKGIACR